MAFKRVHYRAEFDSSLSTQDIVGFVDEFYDRCVKDSVDGLIIEMGGNGQFIVEGNAGDVDNAIAYLDASSSLVNNDTYLTETSGPFYTCLASHVSADAHSSNC